VLEKSRKEATPARVAGHGAIVATGRAAVAYLRR
jgi:hypothetical protein